MYNSNKFFASAFAKSAKKSVLGLTVMLGLNSVAYAQPNLFPTAGNAAIGTSTSAYPLHINRADNVVLNVDGTSTSWSGFYINSKNTTGQPYIAYTANSGASQAWHYLTPAGDWKLNVNSADRLTVLKSGFVGIGTIAPAYPLEVASPTAYLGRFRNSGGTDGSALLDIQNSSGKNWKLAVGGVGNGLGLTAGQFYLESTGVGTVLTATAAGNVGIGTNVPSSLYKLSVNGSIRAKELVVETGWADFVFDKNYKLRSLNEVESYINENKHLPDVPSAADVQANGVKVGEMETLLLQKVEELTLYSIQQNKEIEALKAKLDQLLESK